MNDVTNAPKQRGFTLIELLVVIAIIAGLTTVSVMGITDYVNQNRVKQVAYEFKNSVALARSEAIARDRNVKLRHFDQTYVSSDVGSESESESESEWQDISTGWHIYHGQDTSAVVMFKYQTLADLSVAGRAKKGVRFNRKTGELMFSSSSSSSSSSNSSLKTVCFTGSGITYSVEVSSLGIATVFASDKCIKS
jgi:prepilin-type N-terminal cleavage/methylation domain-containing protein